VPAAEQSSRRTRVEAMVRISSTPEDQSGSERKHGRLVRPALEIRVLFHPEQGRLLRGLIKAASSLPPSLLFRRVPALI
jgi:hypothetical protein